MFTFNIVLTDKDKNQVQRTIAAKSWQQAIDTAKANSRLDLTPETDANLIQVQRTGELHIVAE